MLRITRWGLRYRQGQVRDLLAARQVERWESL